MDKNTDWFIKNILGLKNLSESQSIQIKKDIEDARKLLGLNYPELIKNKDGKFIINNDLLKT